MGSPRRRPRVSYPRPPRGIEEVSGRESGLRIHSFESELSLDQKYLI